ncbi:MAG: mandelate racemase [Xanthobacteraceae bacterium]|jgi:hypothetical protein|nr:mandelate racemase [Xanthobacteraceae bacterium]
MTGAPRLTLVTASFHERPVRLRLPFRFGAATLTQAPQAFARVRIRLEDGREGEGVSADLMVPKWFDKSPALSNDDNFDQLRSALATARRHQLAAPADTAFGLSATVEPAHRADCTAAGLNGLVASFGLSMLDRAIIDALGRLLGEDVFTLVRANRLGIHTAPARDLAGFALNEFLQSLHPAPTIAARHTVGLLDALTASDIADGQRLDDGLPETLEEVIAAYGHTYFKLKVSGQLEADLDRLRGIANVLDTRVGRYFVTLDGNEQFENVDGIVELWRRIGEDQRLARLQASIILVEQPIGRAQALARPVHALSREVPVEIDESDADLDVFPQARALGYRGVSAKSCKGFYRALLNRARIAKWNAEEGEHYAMSAEDLTTQAGIAVQQDLALATLVGATHVERNGHHYVDGMAGAPEAEQRQFLAAHPDLYHRDGGRARITIRNGELAIVSLAHVSGLAAGVMPDWDAMADMRP